MKRHCGSTPPGLLKDILRRFGPYPAPDHSRLTSVPADLKGFRDKLIAGAAKKSQVTRWLMREQPWDMLFVTFAEPHGAGHYLWHAEDSGYPTYPKGGLPGVATPVRDVYAAVDRARLPRALHEAIRELEQSRAAVDILGQDVVDHYLNAARVEQAAYDAVVHPWDRERYLERG